jgi:MSHA biogenesis protein MshI
MKQQVNLLAPMFRKQRALFSSSITLAICALVTATLMLIYLATLWRGAAVAGEQQRLEAQREMVTARLKELATQFSARGHSETLSAEREQLLRERDRRLQTLAALSRRELGNITGFSPQFIGLARQRLNGLWLTRIELSASGAHMALQGVTRSEDLIPRYLRKLGSEPVFSGTRFQHALLQRTDGTAEEMRFELRTLAGLQPGRAP